jgi:hypothetical protein
MNFIDVSASPNYRAGMQGKPKYKQPNSQPLQAKSGTECE